MFSFFRRTFRQWTRNSTSKDTAKKPGQRLQCETLEDRVVPSITTTSSLVNTIKTGAQVNPVTATSANGTSVVVWTEMKGTKDSDIKAQRFDTYGRKVGGEILVAGGRNPQHHPSVAMDAYGSFVVVWTHDFAPGDGDIYGAIFRSDGARLGSGFTVARTARNEFDAQVGRAAKGDFVVSYTYQFGRYDTDVKAVAFRYNATNARTISVATTTRAEDHSRISVAADGRFAISYQSQNNIYVSRYTSSGLRQGAHTVASTSRVESNASVGMDNGGNVIVAWQEQYGRDTNILGRKISSTGSMGNVFTVMAVSGAESMPSVAVDPGTGKTVVAYQSLSGTVTRVLATEFTERQSYVRTSTMGTSLSNPSVSVGGSSRRFLLAANSNRWTSSDADGGIFSVFGNL